MAKKPRQIDPYSLVEVSCRTIGSRYLLKPSKQANDLIAGVLARAARLYPVEVIVFVAMSSHFHALIVAESTERLAEFMRHLNSNLALELGRLYEWRCRFWSDRYSCIQISDEEEAQVRRMKYILAGGVKERLVEKVVQWPGVHCARQLLGDTPLEGIWVNHTYEYRQQRCGKDIDPKEALSVETLKLGRLPCWKHLSPKAYRERIVDLIEQIEKEAAVTRLQLDQKVVGRKAILRKSPHYAPPKQKRSRKPFFFAASKEAYKSMVEAFKDFLEAYMQASARLREGHLDVVFPANCFPPGLPFTGMGLSRAGPPAEAAAELL